MPTLTLRDTSTLYYEQHGQGDDLILVSGFNCDHSVWETVLASLAAKFTVTIFDNRGIGKSLNTREFTIDDMAADIIALMDHLNIEKAHIAGHSMGTKIGMHFALTYPDRLNKLLLLNPQATPIDYPLTEIGDITQKLLELNVPLSLILRSNLLWAYSENFYRNQKALDERVAGHTKMLKTVTPIGIAGQKTALLTDQSQTLSHIQAKTLVIAGKQDVLLLPEHSAFMAKHIPHAQLILMDQCAHMPQFDQPKKLVEHMLDFLK